MLRRLSTYALIYVFLTFGHAFAMSVTSIAFAITNDAKDEKTQIHKTKNPASLTEGDQDNSELNLDLAGILARISSIENKYPINDYKETTPDQGLFDQEIDVSLSLPWYESFSISASEPHSFWNMTEEIEVVAGKKWGFVFGYEQNVRKSPKY